MRLKAGNSRSAAIPWTYCGVTAVSSMTTPAAFALARPAAAVSRARAATSSSSPNKPALIASPPSCWRLPGLSSARGPSLPPAPSLAWRGRYPQVAARRQLLFADEGEHGLVGDTKHRDDETDL